MARFVLLTDRTLMSEYRQISLLPFLPCAPAELIPQVAFNTVSPLVPHDNGLARLAPYGLRKLEASLLTEFGRKEVAVAHPNFVERIIKPDTTVVAVSTMDPLGLGPLSMMFCQGEVHTPYSKKAFLGLVDKIDVIRRRNGYRFKMVVGGPGVWQLRLREDTRKRLNIDHVIAGEADHFAPRLFKDIEIGSIPETFETKGRPPMRQIPKIVAPTVHGVVEAMRGCGRNCDFCDATLRLARYCDVDMVADEVNVNASAGVDNVWLHGEDIFLYKLEDHRHFMPNRDALYELFRSVMSVRGVEHCNPTHGTVSAVVADPEMLAGLSEILRAGPDRWIGVQVGLETGSPSLVSKFMPRKVKPFSPEEWPEVVFEGTRIFNQNYWFPAYTLILGLPGETEDDVWSTVRLIDKMEKELPDKLGEKAHFTVTPMSFVPMAALRGEEFFNIERMATEARITLIYRCWKHTVLEMERYLDSSMHSNWLARKSLYEFIRVGAKLILRGIRRWGKRMGYDPQTATGPA